ncbi:hypothetical protein BH09ACT6_BH09ACT6_25320 [soil metagenome]
MSEPVHPFVDVADIVRLVGRMAFDQARPYSRPPAVSQLSWEPESRLLSARVKGTRVTAYRARVSLTRGATGRWIPRDGTCTCPVQHDCKHVAAVLIASNTAHLREGQAGAGKPAAGKRDVARVGPGGFIAADDAGDSYDCDFDLDIPPLGGATNRRTSAHPAPVATASQGTGARAGAGAGVESGTRRRGTPASASANGRPASPADWRTIVRRLSGSSLADTGSDRAGGRAVSRGSAKPATPTPMALKFEMREFVPRTTEQWRGPVSRAAKARMAGGDHESSLPRRLGVRPAVRSATGNFVTSTVTWRSFSHQLNRLGLEPAHSRWFAQFAAVHRATRDLQISHDSDWLYLDDFESPLLWNLLDEAARLGIRMLGPTKNSTITVAGEALVRLDARTTGSGDLQLTPVVTIGARGGVDGGVEGGDGDAGGTAGDMGAGNGIADPSGDSNGDQRVDGGTGGTGSAAGSAGAGNGGSAGRNGRSGTSGDGRDSSASSGFGSIGDHGVFAFELAPHYSMALAPVPGGLSAEVRGLLGRASDIVVPAREVPEFLEDFYPTLSRAVAVTSADHTMALPAIEPPVLVLTARFRPRNVLGLDWAWQYGSAGKPVRVALHAWDDAHAGSGSGGTSSSDAHARPSTGVRDAHTERAILDRVAAAFTAEADPGELFDPAVPLNPSLVLQGYDAAVFTAKTLPVIEALAGVRVDIVGRRPDYYELTGEPELTITTVESEKRDWFDLGIIVNMGGYRIPFGPLFAALSRGEKKLLMVDKTYLSLEHPAFERLRELLVEANSLDEWETGARISRYQASLWADLEELADETVQATAWRAAVSGLNEVTSVRTVPVPATVDATLRPYQLDGFQWLVFLYEHGLGGVLADDMGLGKTLQALALFAHARQQPQLHTQVHAPTSSNSRRAAAPAPDARPPFLVVAPTSVVSNWVAEAARFTPGLVVHGVTSTQAKGHVPLAELAHGADVVITSYTLFRLDFEAYRALDWSGLVLDEAQFVKNHTSKLHRCAADFDAPFKLAITGTPLENNLMELWSLCAIVAPGLFPSAQKFTEAYVRPIERALDDALLPKLRRRIRPLLMRRTKELVAPELPAKQEQVLQIELAPAHRALYDTFFQRERQKLLGLVEDLDRNRFIVFRSLTLLRMLSLDASLIDEKYAHIPSSKLDALFEQLDDVIAEGHRALVFSQFTSFLGKAASRLETAGIAFEYLDGSTRRRADVIKRFKTGAAPVFLISLKAGGFGLNLTEADYVFLLDPWWNPASESQAIDRTHRIGQTRSVNVYRLVAGATIEEKVMALKEQKARLFDAVMDDDAVFSSALTADDVRSLLEL